MVARVAMVGVVGTLALACSDTRSATATAPEVPDQTATVASTPTTTQVRGFVSGVIDSTTFPDMRSWGATVVRLQLHPGTMPWPTLLDSMESDVRAATAAGLKVVIDMHNAPVANPSEASLWTDPTLQPNLISAWTDIDRRLEPYRQSIWGYDLLNEPLDIAQLPAPPKQWRPIAIRTIRAIRAIDPTVWFIYEPGPGALNYGFTGLVPLPDSRVIYSVHIYDPEAFTKQSFDQADAGEPQAPFVHWPSSFPSLETLEQPVVAFQNSWHVPIYVGEFSVVRWGPEPDAANWLQTVITFSEFHGWSWTYFAFREHTAWDLEEGDQYWMSPEPDPPPSAIPSLRRQVVRAALSR
jgi:Cellulase (glycosyl hydrolase family 5)